MINLKGIIQDGTDNKGISEKSSIETTVSPVSKEKKESVKE